MSAIVGKTVVNTGLTARFNWRQLQGFEPAAPAALPAAVGIAWTTINYLHPSSRN